MELKKTSPFFSPSLFPSFLEVQTWHSAADCYMAMRKDGSRYHMYIYTYALSCGPARCSALYCFVLNFASWMESNEWLDHWGVSWKDGSWKDHVLKEGLMGIII